MTLSWAKLMQKRFWDPTTLDSDNLNAVPVPNDPHQVIGEIDCCTTFQQAVKKF